MRIRHLLLVALLSLLHVGSACAAIGFGNTETTDWVVTKCNAVNNCTIVLPSSSNGEEIRIFAYTTFGTHGTAPAGWTRTQLGASSGVPSLAVYARTSDGALSNPNITLSTTANWVVYALRFTGAATNSSDLFTAMGSGASGGNFAAQDITTTVDGSMVFFLAGSRATATESPSATGYPGSTTGMAVKANTDVFQAAAFFTMTTAGAIGTGYTWSGSVASAASEKSILTYVIAPTVGGGGTVINPISGGGGAAAVPVTTLH